MRPDKQLLIRDLLEGSGDESTRHNALLAGRRVLRRKRYTRVAGRSLAVLASITLVFLTLRPKPNRVPAIVTEIPAAPTPVQSLTDEQLLAMFPDVPVGLATIGDKKVLIFPRPEDQARYIGRF